MNKLHTVFGLDLLEWRRPDIIISLKILRNVLRFHLRCNTTSIHVTNVTSGERERILHLYTTAIKLVPKYKLVLKEVLTGYGSERACA